MEATVSTFEWDGVMETPERKAAAEQLYIREQQERAEKEDALCRFRERQEERRAQRVEIGAVRYAICSMTAAVAAVLFGSAELTWAVWISGGAAVILALLSAYGFGICREMKRK